MLPIYARTMVMPSELMLISALKLDPLSYPPKRICVMSFMADQGAVNTSAFVPWLTRIQMSFALSGTGPLDTLPVFSDSFFQPKSEFKE